MNNEFIPYEQALELKELGFDEECFAHWFELEEKKRIVTKYENSDEWWDYNAEALNVSAPLYQQAFKWFIDKYGSFLLNDYGKVPHFTIMQNLMLENQNMTYEEAELACLKKLIEIVKNK